MPNMLRPRDEFPTPLFAVVVGAAAAGVGGLPGWVLFHGPLLAVHAVATALALALVVTKGTSGKLLLRYATVAAVGMLVVSAAEFLIAFTTYDWE
jgi:hypothetical protein